MPTLRVDGDSSGSVKAFTDLDKAIGKVDDSLELTARRAKQLELAAGQVVKANEGPLDKYNRRMAELAELVKRGALSHDQAAQAADRYRRQLERAGQAGRGAFGTEMLQSLTAAAGGVLSVGAAWGVVSNALTDVEKRAEAASERVIDALGSAGELQQLGSEDYAKNAAFARQLRRTGAVDLNQAFDVSMNLGSAGYSDEEKQFFAKVVEERIVKAENLDSFGSNLRRIQNIFGDGAGSLEDIYSRVSVAGDEAITDINTTANSLAKFGSGAKSVGVGSAESLAAFIVAESQSSSPDAASEKLKSFFAQVDKRNVADGDLSTILGVIQGRQSKGESLYDILGEQNAVLGYSDLVNAQDRLRDLTDRLAGAPASGIFSDQASAMDQVPFLRTADNAKRAQAELDSFREGESEAASIAKAIMAEQDLTAAKSGKLSEVLLALQRYTGGNFTSEGQVNSAAYEIEAEGLFGRPSPYSERTTRDIQDFMRRQAEASERTAAAVEALNDKKTSGEAVKTSTRPARP